jgi:hypothetical protein
MFLYGDNFGYGTSPRVNIDNNDAEILKFTNEYIVVHLNDSTTNGAAITPVLISQGSGDYIPTNTYIKRIEFDYISPLVGRINGGSVIKIFGNGFSADVPNDKYLKFFDENRYRTELNDIFTTYAADGTLRAITSKTPEPATSMYIIKMSTDGIRYVAPSIDASMYFTTYQKPVIHSFSPSGGPLSGGTSIVVICEFFVTGFISVKFGDIEVQCDFRTSWSITCVSPKGLNAGPVNIGLSIDGKILNEAKEFVTAPNQFYYFNEAEYDVVISDLLPDASPRIHAKNDYSYSTRHDIHK